MKTLRVVNEKHFIQEEIKLSPADIETAIKEFLESRIEKFQTGWSISVDHTGDANAVCSKWAGFTCPKCSSSMTVVECESEGCFRAVCEGQEAHGKCCGCA
jgi:hypothetical protein